MKDKRNKYIKIIANKLVDLEKELQLGKNVQENRKKIKDIMDSLSLEDAIKVDSYIIKKKLLT
jgi:ribosomal protein S17E